MSLLTVAKIVLFINKRYSLWAVKSVKIGIYNTELRKNDDRVGTANSLYYFMI